MQKHRIWTVAQRSGGCLTAAEDSGVPPHGATPLDRTTERHNSNKLRVKAHKKAKRTPERSNFCVWFRNVNVEHVQPKEGEAGPFGLIVLGIRASFNPG